jgi:acyl dehydratase
VSDGGGIAGITDAGIERLRARIGVPEPHPVPPHFLRPNEDAFRHVAEAYGDDNPLYCDRAYGASTRWGSAIAPPLLVGGDSLIGEDEVAEVPAAHRETMRGDPLRGAHAFYSGSAHEWWHPLLPARRVLRRNALVGVHDKPSGFAGRAVHEWTAQVFADEEGHLLAGQYRLMIRTDRGAARERGQNKEVKIEPYSREAIEEIDAQYRSEMPRGATPRHFEDVEIGDALDPLVKGPLTVTDMVCWHAGVGMGLYGVKALRLGFRNRQRIPRFYQPDELGIPDAMQRCHWDPEYARRAGNPTTYDYGRMREAWLMHLCTSWMGDDAWLWKLDCEFRKFNFVGDTHWMRGRVTRKYLALGGRPAVDLELAGRNQRGELTTPGHASILLPSREHGPVRLPDPPDGAVDLPSLIDALARRFAREERAA